MKKVVLILLSILFLFLGTTGQATVHAQDAQNSSFVDNLTGEHIHSFNSRVQINKDGTIDVKESIDYDFGDTQHHGIYRVIPFIKVNDAGKRFKLNFDIQSITDENGASYGYSKSTDSDNLNIKIGDPNRTISGRHMYILTYTVSGAIGYFSDHDELYWNVTGTDWDVPMATASASFGLPSEVKEIRTACFTGGYGSKQAYCNHFTDPKTAYFSTQNELGDYEGLTAVVGFPKGLVAVLNPVEQINFWDTFIGKVTAFLGWLALAVASLWWYIIYPIKIAFMWWQRGRDPQATVGEVTAGFDPPKTSSGRPLSPAETGTVVDEEADFADISATIVDLARRGYFKIEERAKKDFYFIKQKDWENATLLSHERELLNGIFADDDEVRIKDLPFYETIGTVKKAIYTNVMDDKFFDQNPDAIRTFYTGISAAAVGTLNIPLLISSLIFGRNLPRRTVTGIDAKNEALSLKNFLTSQERQLNFQAKNQMMFEKLLPYAVAFGVEKIWAQRFEKFNLKPPTWYSGYGSTSNFNSTYFVSNLGNSFSSVQSVSHPPASSSSSGFSGGGFSGGGGGGGGGGSW